jgi:hypothetical protein
VDTARYILYYSVADPNPSDRYFLGLLDPDPLVIYGSGSFYHQSNIVSKALIPTVW